MSGDFDICGPLPTGTTVLEASAGTGKTFTIAALATRYVAEGEAELHQLMLVTFGRMATQELRERVRERLVSAERGLADPALARGHDHDDDLLRLLAAAPDDEVAARRARLRTALADFDAATLTTTHGFCLQMLRGLGVAGDFEPDATFVESIDDLVEEVAGDLWLRKFGRLDSPEPPLGYSEALHTVRRAVEDGQADLVPSDAAPGTTPDQRFRMACAARTEVEARKRQRRLIGFDDLLTRLLSALKDPETGAAAQQRVRSRYRVVLVDEFQDTDPVQWEILRLAFHGATTLVLIGDPKQAIYAFRGGDVVAYLAATEAATARATLGRNWRSDELLLGGLQQLFRQASLGDPRITVHPVDSAHPSRRLSGAPVDAPVRVRVVTRAHTGTAPTRAPAVGPTRDVVADDLAGEVVRLLSSGARLMLDDAVGAAGRPVAPGDLAVLVHTNKQAALVRERLVTGGVPAVITGAANVFTTDIARDWLVLLQALEQPRGARVRTAALTCFLGWSAQRLAAAGDEALDELGPRLRSWAEVLARRGVPALLERMTNEERLTARMLSAVRGERRLTDLRHVAQALHVAAVEGQLGTAALVEWLQRRIVDAAGDPSEERVRRLESDAEAVQVVTYHRSKGLEFPVVYVPYGWDSHKEELPDLLRLHVEGVRTIDVGGPSGPHYQENLVVHRREDAGEDLRMLYVALTRAKCQVVTWWAPTGRNTTSAPLHRLLFGDHAAGAEPPQKVPLPADDEVHRRLTGLAAASGGALAAEPAAPQHGLVWRPAAGEPPALSAAAFSRSLDTSWRRLSYTALTAGVHEQQLAAAAAAGVSTEPDERRLDDETAPGPPPAVSVPTGGTDGTDSTDSTDTTDTTDTTEVALRAVVSPMGDLPSGAAFGIVVHSLLEYADTTAPDLALELTERARAALSHRLGPSLDPEVLGPALVPSMQTPLGPVGGGVRLADILPGDRLSELGFELPLAGGDRSTAGEATLVAMAEVLRRHVPPDDPFGSYPDLLAALPPQRLRGYLTGSLDAVLRLRADGAGGSDGPRYVVADYKTNWLGDAWPGVGEPLTAWHYRPQAMTEEMLGAHYPLQALLYLVALHRYLAWRQPGYEPATHLGGVLYLFVRGMCGPGTPVVDGSPCGVFGWVPPDGLVEDLSLLLAGRAP